MKTLLRSLVVAPFIVLGLERAASAALPMLPEQIAVTCFSGTVDYNTGQVTPNLTTNGFVVAILDTRNSNIGPLIPPVTQPPYLWSGFSTPPFSGFHNEPGQRWTSANIGEVFGITVDDATPPNIYVTATDSYNQVGATPGLPAGPGGRGGVYKLNGANGNITWASLPNHPTQGPGHGNICYRRAANGNGFLYVSDLENGLIYRLNTSLANMGSPFDHGVQGRLAQGLTPQIPDLGTPGLTQFGRRIWGLKTYQNRLFYAVWWEDGRNPHPTQSNEVWSVDLDNTGNFVPATARRRIILPNFTVNNWSFPVASIDFSPNGAMFLAERYWQVWTSFQPNASFGAHHTRLLRYTLSGPNWVTTPNTTHHIGGDPNPYFPNTLVGANSGGGVAVNCDESIWATGDMFAGSYSTPPNVIGGPGDLGAVYGALRIPTGGNSALAGYGYGSFAIDFDGLTNPFSDVDKFAVGSVTTVRDCCVPPPANMVAWWPLDEPNGATVFSDLSGNGNTAIVESGGPVGNFGSPQAISGKVAGGKYFIDAATRGRALNSATLNFGAGSFSVDCWVRPIPNPWQPIVDKFDQPSSTGYAFGVSNGLVVLRVGDGTTYTHIGPAVTFNAWNFAAVSVDRTANTVTFHLNGVTGTPQPLSAASSLNNTLDLLIGAAYDTNVVSEVGLDEIELFDRDVKAGEWEALFLADRSGKCKTPTPPCTNSVVSIVCPPDMSIETCASRTNVVYPLPVASTTCGTITNIVCTPPSGSPFPPGTTQVTCTATDSSGVTATCTFNITVKTDTTPPFIDCNCLTNFAHEVLTVIGCEGAVPDLCRFTPCFRDACCVICTQSIPYGTVVGPGSYPITVTISDCAGNTNSCTLTFVVIPPPEGCDTPCLHCPPDNITVVGCPPLMPDYSTNSFGGTNCAPAGPLLVVQSIPPGTPLAAGNTNVALTVCDALGNCITCVVAIKVVPTTGNPSITCPPNQVLLTCSNRAVGYYKVIASGHTGPVLCTPPSGSSFPLGVTTVTCTATNACGGSASCSFTVLVKAASPLWCRCKLGIGIPYDHIGDATTAIAPLDGIKIIGPAICVFPNPNSTASGIIFKPGRAKAITFTTELELTGDEGPSLSLVLPPAPGQTHGTPLMEFRRKSNGNGYCIKSNTRITDEPNALYRSSVIGTNGDLFASFMLTPEDLETDFLHIFGLPGVDTTRMTVTVDLETLAVTLDFEHCLWTADSARKGWDGCIYGPPRPPGTHRGGRFTLAPLNPVSAPITQIALLANGLAEILVDNPSITELGRKWGDGHVTLMKAYDDGEGLQFRAFANGGGVHVDLGHSESFDLGLQRFSTLGDERLLTRTLGSIVIPGSIPPPFLDAMMLQGTPEGVRCSADFSNIGSPTVQIQVYNQGMPVAERVGVMGGIGQPLLILPDWPLRLGKLGGTTPCRRGKIPPGNIIIPSSNPTVPPETVFGDEFRILAEVPAAAPHPDYYSGFEFVTSDGAEWGVTDIQRTHACPPSSLHLAPSFDGTGGLSLTWDCAGFLLEGAEDLDGPWHDLGVQSPVSVHTNWPWRFFRLRDR